MRDTKNEIQAILDEVDDNAQEIPRTTEKKLRDAVKSPPGWARAKTTGLGILDRAARATGERLLQRFGDIGLYVVPVGEIESFEASQTASKNEWVNAVLEAHKNDLDTTPALQKAREFVSSFICRQHV